MDIDKELAEIIEAVRWGVVPSEAMNMVRRLTLIREFLALIDPSQFPETRARMVPASDSIKSSEPPPTPIQPEVVGVTIGGKVRSLEELIKRKS